MGDGVTEAQGTHCSRAREEDGNGKGNGDGGRHLQPICEQLQSVVGDH